MMYNAMLAHFNNNPISLHVPGHHYQTIGHLKDIPIKYDVTEITGMDDYHHAEGVIKDSEHLLNKQGYQSRFLVNGTTVGLLAVIMAYVNASQTPSIAIMRNAHKSIYNAISLGKGSAYILPTAISQVTKEFSDILLDEIDLSMLSSIKLAVLTYPNYYGETYDVQKVIEFFHQHHIPVLIDEAHGAHFDISNQFPKSALNYGADYIVQSYHKTLPTFTMSSVLHIHEKTCDNDILNVQRNLSMLQSSSPSYMLMLGLESAHQFYLHYDDRLFFVRRNQLIDKLSSIFDVIEVDDPLKIMLSIDGYSGYEISECLEEKSIFTELSNDRFTLCVLPLWHVGDDYLFDTLLNRIETLNMEPRIMKSMDRDELLYNQQDGVFISQEKVNTILLDIHQCLGRISAEHIVPYPPGIPYILAGEAINSQQIAHITSFIASGGIVHGVDNLKIRVVE
ncbi:lysine decarboxylase [Macrococcoides caseolyticum]|uniref:Orn/Lys/Arg family decarboxylase n=1 Tax=Macrococcoides caseolyticum TaxID=69966 RepID=UPI001F3AD271|nr:lysine decarboxylase [Macrococcus caseolyticus]MCE4957925.1 lysine decarboxylase [Macrococcus caseolyticus]